MCSFIKLIFLLTEKGKCNYSKYLRAHRDNYEEKTNLNLTGSEQIMNLLHATNNILSKVHDALIHVMYLSILFS